MILKAFENGADGVLVIGCLEGDCHFQVGNLRARKRVERVAGLLETAGVGGERVRMVNLSAGEGARFVAYATEMVEHIAGLGPSPVNLARGGQQMPAAESPAEANVGEPA
jgi:coenzyme F420-reducing hydrogenase delta subunit